MKLRPSHRLYGLGAILLVALTIGHTAMLSGPDSVKATAPYAILRIQGPLYVIQRHIRSFTEEEPS